MKRTATTLFLLEHLCHNPSDNMTLHTCTNYMGVRKYGLFGTPNPKLPLTNNVNPTLILGIFLKKWEL